jgi:hypothetical protein
LLLEAGDILVAGGVGLKGKERPSELAYYLPTFWTAGRQFFALSQGILAFCACRP